jgi:homoserine acetyltransferase
MMAHITYLSRRRDGPQVRPAQARVGRGRGLHLRRAVRGRELPAPPGPELHQPLRRELLPLHHARARPVRPGAAYGSLEQAFAPVQAESLVVGFTSDWLFPPEQNRAIALALLRAGKRASYAELATDLGHDSFLLESEELYALVRGFLERDEAYVFDFAI